MNVQAMRTQLRSCAAVRLTEQRNHPDLSPDELAWRVTRRMQGNPRLGREDDSGAARD